MDNDYREFIALRCAKALEQDSEYQNLRLKGVFTHEEEIDIIIRVSYSAGFFDREYVAEKCSQYYKIYQ